MRERSAKLAGGSGWGRSVTFQWEITAGTHAEMNAPVKEKAMMTPGTLQEQSHG